MSLRERLAAKQRTTIQYRLAVEDWGPAHRRLQDAENELAAAEMRHRDAPEHEEIQAARRRVEQAKAEHDACYEWITMRAMPAPEFEALVELHKPTPEQKAADDEARWNHETILAPLLAACVEGDMTEGDWKGFLSTCSNGEKNSLHMSAIGVNIRIPDPSVPKGSTPTLS